MTTLTGALDALPVPEPTPAHTASWPVEMDAAAFAATMEGALLLLHPSSDGAMPGLAVVVEATGAEAVRILPSAPQGAASAAYLDRVVKAHVPRCFSDGREGMEFPTPAGPLRMQWNEGGVEGFQVTVRLAAAQIRREGQLPSAVVGQGPITTALEAAAVPWVPRAAAGTQPTHVDLSTGLSEADAGAFGRALARLGLWAELTISSTPVAEVHALSQLVAAWGSRAGKAGRLVRLLMEGGESGGRRASIAVIQRAATLLLRATAEQLDRVSASAAGLAALVGGTPAALGAILANELPDAAQDTLLTGTTGQGTEVASAAASRALVVHAAQAALAHLPIQLSGGLEAANTAGGTHGTMRPPVGAACVDNPLAPTEPLHPIPDAPFGRARCEFAADRTQLEEAY